MSFASRSVINSKGLHVLTTGISGKGKSHGYDTMLGIIPQECRLSGRLSDKSLFYSEDLKPRAAICLDDNSLSDQMQEILKGVTSSFKEPFIYRTVNKDRKGEIRKIPERCVWWVAKMEGTGDDQVWNRMLTVWVDESKEQDDRVLNRELDDATLPPQPDIVRHEVLVCQQIWRSLSDKWVIIPFAKQIRFSSSENRRNTGMLLDIIRAHAVLMQHQREYEEYNGISCIIATVEDFKVASKLFQALNGESGGQMSKLTRSESDLVSFLHDSYKNEIKISEMQEMTGKSYSAIQKMLHGSVSHGTHYSGILEKCPALSYLDRTDVSDNGDTSKRSRVYVWNDDLYNLWVFGGGCWLNENDPDDGHDDSDDRLNVGNERKTAESFRREEYENTASDSNNINNNKNNFLDNTLRRKDESSQYPVESGTTYIRDFQVSADPFLLTLSEQPDTPVLQSEADNTLRKIPLSSAGTPVFPPGEPILRIEDVDPGKFHKVDEVRKGPCDVCGKRWVTYIEGCIRGRNPVGLHLRSVIGVCPRL